MSMTAEVANGDPVEPGVMNATVSNEGGSAVGGRMTATITNGQAAIGGRMTVTITNGAPPVVTGTMTATIVNGDPVRGIDRLSDADFDLWQLDTSRASHRVLLMQLSHAGGRVTVASGEYLNADPPYEAYDAWLVGDAVMEDALDNFRGVGDITILDQEDGRDLLAFFWRGYPARLLFGDDEWPLSDFRPVGSYLISGVRNTGPRAYSVDLIDGGQFLKRPFSILGDGSTASVEQTIRDILASIGRPDVVFTGITPAQLDYRVSVEYRGESRADTALRELADALGAYLRITAAGDLELFIPDTEAAPNLTIVDDDIVQGSVSMVQVVPAYARVQIDMAEGDPVARDTGAPTGSLNETKVVKTLLRRPEDAEARLPALLRYHATPHAIWRLGVLHAAGQIEKGDSIRVEHEEFTGTGIVSHIRRSLLGIYDTIEITA